LVASRREPLRRRFADSRRGARHERDLSCDLSHVILLKTRDGSARSAGRDIPARVRLYMMAVILVYMTIIMYNVKGWTTSGDQDESEQRTSRPEPRTDRRDRRPAIPRAGLRRDRRRGSHERGGSHPWRVLRAL